MKTDKNILWRSTLVAVAASSLAISCSQESNPEPSKPMAEIRGTPINAAPVETNAPAVAETPKPAEPVVAEAAPVAAPMPTPAPETAKVEALTTAAKEATVPAAAPAAPAELTKDASGALIVGFDQLASFTYLMPEDAPLPKDDEVPLSGIQPPSDKIPKEIQALNDKTVALKGFMLPLKVEGGLVTELLIMRDQSMCCYGTVPKINEWVSVKMEGKGVKPVMDQAITMYGKLRVGEIHENGYLVGIYEMSGNKMADPLDM